MIFIRSSAYSSNSAIFSYYSGKNISIRENNFKPNSFKKSLNSSSIYLRNSSTPYLFFSLTEYAYDEIESSTLY